ncbi:MAG: endonuclease domain-containing protein [Rhodanobacteraceae bacterium]|nr:MAG: endonuclease domain-containing protein [Rhodanobacteraceae bacterium]
MPHRVSPPLSDRTRDAAKSLRIALTDAERKLWFHLRGSRLGGMKFRRQHPIPPYIVDFYCETAKLAVELDGSQHNEAIDQRRSRYLADQGLCILRFWDNDVLQNTEAALEIILSTAQELTLTPNPSPEGEGEKSKARP